MEKGSCVWETGRGKKKGGITLVARGYACVPIPQDEPNSHASKIYTSKRRNWKQILESTNKKQ